MSNTETPTGLFVDALTGESIVRELTADEIAALVQVEPVVDEPATEEEPAVDEPIEGEQP